MYVPGLVPDSPPSWYGPVVCLVVEIENLPVAMFVANLCQMVKVLFIDLVWVKVLLEGGCNIQGRFL